MGIFSSKPKKAVRPPNRGWSPRDWATWIPFRHPDNFLEVFRALWENRGNLRYALRILNHGVCDGCALGTTGMKDWTIDGIHLCNVRLRLLRMNTLPALDIARLIDVAPLRDLRARDLREMGRIPYPMIRRKGEAGFTRISWDAALDLIAAKLKTTAPDRAYFYLTSRGIPNETYYAAQKAVRAIGTNNIDNASRMCHSPSTLALKTALGVGATTCSYTDFIGTDVITFIGSNVASNQPLVMKYLYHAKKAGTQIVSVNPFREPGMEAYWIPSDIESAMFGTKMADQFVQVRAGGDIAFLHAAAKLMIERGWVDSGFISQHTEGFETLCAYLDSLTWEALESESGVAMADLESYAERLHKAERAIFVWGMGITQHTCGEDNVHAIINLALLKGFIGREGCGLMPIRGHSGVQGGAEMGAYATVLPGGITISPESAATLSAQYGFDVPTRAGLTTPEMLDAAAQGDIDVLFAVGGNFREVMPDPKGITRTLENIPLRVHMDIVPSSQMWIDPAETVILLPAATRYEIPGGVTQTSTERRVMFSPEIPGPRIGEARGEGDVLGDLAARVRPELADKVRFDSTQAIREEIASVIPYYDGIQNLRAEGDQFQYGGAMLCEGWNFPTPDGKAHFKAATLPVNDLAEGELRLVTRRGKQFNSMVHEDKESGTGYRRDAVILSASEAKSRGLSAGEAVRLTNAHGTYTGVLVIGDIAGSTVEVYWPEANVLLDPGGAARSPLAHIPAYKSGRVSISRAVDSEPVAVRV